MKNHNKTTRDFWTGDERPSVVRALDLKLVYGPMLALNKVSCELPAGCMVGLIGPDGVGKSSLLALISGSRQLQQGTLEVLGGDMAAVRFRREISPRIAYMPQGLGKNLYPTLSVFENVDFFGRLFGHSRAERHRRICELLESTGLAPFARRPAGKLSGGMKQKLGLCCALIHDPDLLILDEPTTGVDPLSRRQFWELIERIRVDQPGMSVLVATAYMDEASRFDWLVAMDDGRILDQGTPRELLSRTNTDSLETAFIALLPEEKRQGYREVVIHPRVLQPGNIAIEACELTKRFGDFVAVDRVNFRIEKGEIFGFLGSNGCGKSTTMKILTGLLPASEGQAWLFGQEVDAQELDTRRRIGYMSQAFSLYTELTVRQNLVLHARLFQVPEQEIPHRVEEMAERFGLHDILEALPDALPLGQRQRLSLAVALVHKPELLILDEPTSGVDPVARDAFWQLLIDLSRRDHVTIFISTHFVNEAERCDRISLMHGGRVLVSDTPEALTRNRGATNLEEAFIGYLEDASREERTTQQPAPSVDTVTSSTQPSREPPHTPKAGFSLRRMFSYTVRESLELRRDPIRGTLALLGSVILMFVMGYGISMDVEDLSFAVLDLDQTTLSRNYIQEIRGSRYFIEQPPLESYRDLDRRMRSGKLSLALEIPPGFGRDLSRGKSVEIGAWIDGAMPQRAETVRGYVEGMHAHWLSSVSAQRLGKSMRLGPATIEARFRYNPDIKSLVAMVPAVIPLLLMLIPAMLAALSVVREKELGSITNLYVTPVTRLEFLVGKQLPYIALAMVNFLLLAGLAVTIFRVPMTGSFGASVAGALLYVTCATALGLFISTFMRSQIAAMFGTAIFTLIPATQFSGMIDPVSALEGFGAMISRVYPTTHFLTISRGTFSKALGFTDLWGAFIPLVLAIPVILGVSVVLLKKQEA